MAKNKKNSVEKENFTPEKEEISVGAQENSSAEECISAEERVLPEVEKISFDGEKIMPEGEKISVENGNFSALVSQASEQVKAMMEANSEEKIANNRQGGGGFGENLLENADKISVSAEEAFAVAEANAKRIAAEPERVDTAKLQRMFDEYFNLAAETNRLRKEIAEMKVGTAPERIFDKSEYVESAANNSAVEKKVIEKYLLRLAGGAAPQTLTAKVGKTGFSPDVFAPKTLAEAKRLADLLMEG